MATIEHEENASLSLILTVTSVPPPAVPPPTASPWVAKHPAAVTLLPGGPAMLPFRMLANSTAPRFASSLSPVNAHVAQQFESSIALMKKLSHPNVLSVAPKSLQPAVPTAAPSAGKGQSPPTAASPTTTVCLPACVPLMRGGQRELRRFSVQEILLGVKDVVSGIMHVESHGQSSLLSVSCANVAIASPFHHCPSSMAGRWILYDLTTAVPSRTAAAACTAGAVARWLGEEIINDLDDAHWHELDLCCSSHGENITATETTDDEEGNDVDADEVWSRMRSLFASVGPSGSLPGSFALAAPPLESNTATRWGRHLARWVIRAHEALNLPKPKKSVGTHSDGLVTRPAEKASPAIVDEALVPAADDVQAEPLPREALAEDDEGNPVPFDQAPLPPPNAKSNEGLNDEADKVAAASATTVAAEAVPVPAAVDSTPADGTTSSVTLLQELVALLEAIACELPFHRILTAATGGQFNEACSGLSELIRVYDAVNGGECGQRLTSLAVRRVIPWTTQPSYFAAAGRDSSVAAFIALLTRADGVPKLGAGCRLAVGRAIAAAFAEPTLGTRDFEVRAGLLSVVVPALGLDRYAVDQLAPMAAEDDDDDRPKHHPRRTPVLPSSFCIQFAIFDSLNACLTALEAHVLVAPQPEPTGKKEAAALKKALDGCFGPSNPLVLRLQRLENAASIIQSLQVASMHLNAVRTLLLPLYSRAAELERFANTRGPAHATATLPPSVSNVSMTGTTTTTTSSVDEEQMKKIRQLALENLRSVLHKAIIPFLSVVAARVVRPLAATVSNPQFPTTMSNQQRDDVRDAIGALCKALFGVMVDVASPLGAVLFGLASQTGAGATARAVALSIVPMLLLLPVPAKHRVEMLEDLKVLYPMRELGADPDAECPGSRGAAAAALVVLAMQHSPLFATAEVEGPLRALLPLVATLCAVPNGNVRSAAAAVSKDMMLVLREAVGARVGSAEDANEQSGDDNGPLPSSPLANATRSVASLNAMLQRTAPGAALEASPLPPPLLTVALSILPSVAAGSLPSLPLFCPVATSTDEIGDIDGAASKGKVLEGARCRDHLCVLMTSGNASSSSGVDMNTGMPFVRNTPAAHSLPPPLW